MKKPTFRCVVSTAPTIVAAAPNAASRVPKPNSKPSSFCAPWGNITAPSNKRCMHRVLLALVLKNRWSMSESLFQGQQRAAEPEHAAIRDNIPIDSYDVRYPFYRYL